METNYFAFFPLIILPTVFGLFIWMFLRKDRQHPAEALERSTLTASCGGIVGWLTYKGPFIRLAIYADFLVVACDKVYYFPFGEIVQIEQRSFLFHKGYRIHHKNLAYPQRIEVWPPDREAFEAALAGRVQII